MIAILSTSCTLIVPLLNWSEALRHLGSRDDRQSGTRTIVIYWAFLVTVGLMTTLSQLSGFNPVEAHMNPIICATPQMSTMECLDIFCFMTDISADWIQANGCLDPCKDAYPTAIFRSPSDLQLMSRSEIFDINSVWAGPFIFIYFNIGAALGIFVLLQGIWAACFGRRTPTQCRNTVYSILTKFQLPSPACYRQRRTGMQMREHWRRCAASSIAIAAYLWTVVASVLCVLLFFLSIAAMEYLLSTFPQSESAFHVGAWTPWATTALLIIAAVVAKHHDGVVSSSSKLLKQGFSNTKFLIKHGFQDIKINRTHEGHPVKRNRTGSKLFEFARVKPRFLRLLGCISSFLGQLILRALRSLQEKRSGVISTIGKEWDSLTDFWRDPNAAVEAAKA